MRRGFAVPAAALAALVCAGCVERQMTLVTRPEGALAYYNGRPVGKTPVTFHFTYYQAPELRFERDGFRTLRVIETVRPPFYECFPLDFFAEVLLPFTIYDRRTFEYTLEERTEVEPEAVVERAQEMRRETAADPPQ